jgi:hypothetical protein
MPQIGILDVAQIHDDAEVKRAALLFDKIGFVGMAGVRDLGTMYPCHTRRYVRECERKLEFLIDNGIALEPLHEERIAYNRLTAAWLDGEVAKYTTPYTDDAAQESSHFDLDAYTRNLGATSGPPLEQLGREVAGEYSRTTGERAVIVASAQSGEMPLPSGVDLVVEVVLNQLPMPTSDTPWDDVLRFRDDNALRTSYFQLHRWINHAATQSNDRGVLRDELRALLAEYREAVQIHRLRFKQGGLRALLTIIASTLQNALTANLTASVDALFSIRDRRIALIDEERRSPGREVAYIFDANERFSVKEWPA